MASSKPKTSSNSNCLNLSARSAGFFFRPRKRKILLVKKTIQILGNILGAVGILLGVLCLFIGIYALNNSATLRQSPTILSRLTDEEYLFICVFYIFLGGLYLTGSVFEFIHAAIARRTDVGKIKGILLGAFGVAFGAPITGVLTIIDSAIHRPLH